MEMTDYPNGMFCWPELSAMDVQRAKSFYSDLFDWGLNESPIDEAGNAYIMLQKNGVDIGAMYQGKTELEKSQMITHWLGYIAVDDVDSAASKVEGLGGTVEIQPMDVFAAGRMAVINDPGGARVALWQGKEHKGAKIIGATGTVCWNELATREVDACKTFYQGIVGWQPQTKPMEGMDYTLFMLNECATAGMLAMTKEWGDMPSHWMTYFAVDDCDIAAERATSLGGEVCVPPTDIDEVGRFSVITDPQGAVFSIIKLAAEMEY
jgi:uncharacterized protein